MARSALHPAGGGSASGGGHRASSARLPVQGGHGARGRAEPAQQWFQLLDAPTKKMVIFELAGHRTLFQQPDLFYQLMTTTVPPQIQRGHRTDG